MKRKATNGAVWMGGCAHRFFCSTRKMTTPVTEEAATKRVPWPKSEARRLLYADLEEGRYRNMQPKAIYLSRPENKQWGTLDQWRGNYYTARDSTAYCVDSAAAANQALVHDQDIVVAARGHGFYYPKSSVQTLLREDVKNETLMGMKPQELRATRADYQVLTLEKFRNYLAYEKKRLQKKKREAAYTERMAFITGRIGEAPAPAAER